MCTFIEELNHNLDDQYCKKKREYQDGFNKAISLI